MTREEYHGIIKEHGIYEYRAHEAVDIVLDTVAQRIRDMLDSSHPALVAARLYGIIYDMTDKKEVSNDGRTAGEKTPARPREIPEKP